MRRWWRLALFVLFIGVPLLEIYVLIQVGQVIGPWWTILLLVLDSILGTWLIKREGSKAWRALRQALETGRMPGQELADGALILVGGTLMLSPGFVTDALGIVLIWPITRPAARRLLSWAIGKRLLAGTLLANARHPGPGTPRRASGDGPVVRGEVVDED